MAGVTRLELATLGVTGRYSNQLSYTPIRNNDLIINKNLFCKNFFYFFQIFYNLLANIEYNYIMNKNFFRRYKYD